MSLRWIVACLVLVLGVAGAQDLFDPARGGTVDDVEAALAAGGSVDAVDADGNTPLLLAVWHNSADVVAALLDAGADPHYANPRTGMGIFGLVWRNPAGAEIRGLFAERGLVAAVGVRPGSEDAEDPPPEPPDAPTAPAEPARPRPDAPLLPERTGGLSGEGPTPEDAADLGYVYRPGATAEREEVRDWVTSRFVLNGPLAANTYVDGCRAAVLDLMRAPESVIFGEAREVVLGDEGVITYTSYALAAGRDGASRRWSLSCTGFVEDDVLHLWVGIEAR
jgi:hypothetical protein